MRRRLSRTAARPALPAGPDAASTGRVVAAGAAALLVMVGLAVASTTPVLGALGAP